MSRLVLRPIQAVTLLVCVLFISPLAFSDSFARIVRLSDVEGSVQIDRNTGHGFERALLNMPVTQGVRLRTGVTGRAEVEFENGSVVRMAGDSSVEFTQLLLRSNGDRVSEINVGQGTVYIDAHRKKSQQFRIAVGNHVFNLDHDVHLRLAVDRSRAEIAVMKGELRVPDPVEMAKVKKNQTFTLDLTDASQDTLAKGISPLPTDDYDRQRSEYDNLYARNNSYGSPYAYGYSDMYRYGSFFNLPSYGLVWQPASVGLGWDPYSNGYWSLYPGQGYVWVSGYPWGWMPYRYGNWMFVPNYGWCWRPGAWNQWNTGVAVVNPPPTWKGPVTPAQGSGTTVVVGRPIPLPLRPIRTDDFERRRVGGLAPAATLPATGATTRTGNPANANSVVSTPGVRPTAPASATDHPGRPSNMMRNADAMENQRGRGMPSRPSMAPPSKSMSQPAPTMAPMQPPRGPEMRPAPAPRMSSPERSMGGGVPMRMGGGGSHPMSAPHPAPASSGPHK